MAEMHVSIDIETFSDVDIGKCGAYKYALSPAFEILLCAFKIDNEPTRIIDLTEPDGDERMEVLYELIHSRGVTAHAYNAAFEWWCINQWAKRRGLEELPASKWRCTMLHGLYCGYTAGLAATGEAIGLPADKRKLAIGGALIRKFCVPQKPTKADPNRTRIRKKDEPEKWELFKEYCVQDVETEHEIERRLSKWPVPDREQRLWELDMAMHVRGVGVDMEMVHGAQTAGNAETEMLLTEAKEISGLENPKSVKQLMAWLEDEGTTVEDLRKGTVAELLGGDLESDRVRRMLELRQQLSKTSTKKYDAIEKAVCDDGRVRGISLFYGAHTGRWCGRLIQLQNLPRNYLSAIEYARTLATEADNDAIRMCYGSVPDTLSQLIRTAFVPSKGKIYAVADYSAIEARVLAWIAGEQWVLDAFSAGKDIYCETAAQMFGVPVQKGGVNGHLRGRGKVATLALGYGGGENALIAMGALDMGIPEEDLPGIKQMWRAANPSITALWRAYDKASMLALKTGEPQRCGRGIVFRYETDTDTAQDFLTIELPTGRKLFYAHPHLKPARNFPDRESLHYYSVNQTTRKWTTTDTWGGKLAENITQAVARDLLAETLTALDRAGIPVVFHVHDEVICEVDRKEDLKTVLDIMGTAPGWAKDLPLKGAGFTSDFYMKD